MAGVHDAHQVDGKHPLEPLGRRLEEGSALGLPRIVDEDGDPAALGRGLPKRLSQGIAIGDICGSKAHRPDLARGLLRPFGIAAEDGDGRTTGDQSARDGQPDTARSPGYQGVTAVKRSLFRHASPRIFPVVAAPPERRCVPNYF